MLAAASRNWPMIVQDVVYGVPLATHSFHGTQTLVCVPRKNHLAINRTTNPLAYQRMIAFRHGPKKDTRIGWTPIMDVTESNKI